MNILKTRIGIIGGGQLGKMMILEAKRLGFYITVLDPTKKCPASSLCDHHIIAAFDDKDAIKSLAEQSDVITYEFEHIDVDILLQLEEAGVKIYPTAQSLKTIQNKLWQKEKLQEGNIPVPAFLPVADKEDIKSITSKLGYPLVIKTRTGGYDGKGNFVLKNQQEIDSCLEFLGGDETNLMAEEYISFEKEVSVLACRGIDGSICVYPVGENRHVNAILDETKVPADISADVTASCMEISRKVMEIFQGVGMFCVELFVTDEGAVYVNEVAPRPHNSGHYTIEGTTTNQFEQHIRAVTGLPMGQVELIKPCAMRNLLGENGFYGDAVFAGVEDALKLPNVKVHVYGKEKTAAGRKMGHLTVTAEKLDEAVTIASQAKALIKVIGEEAIN